MFFSPLFIIAILLDVVSFTKMSICLFSYLLSSFSLFGHLHVSVNRYLCITYLYNARAFLTCNRSFSMPRISFIEFYAGRMFQLRRPRGGDLTELIKTSKKGPLHKRPSCKTEGVIAPIQLRKKVFS